MVKIFVGGFPLETTELELVQIVSLYGQVDTIKIVRDKKTGVCKGYAFLEMVDMQAAENTIESLDGSMFRDKLLSVKFGIEKPAGRPTSQTFKPRPFKSYNTNSSSPSSSPSSFNRDRNDDTKKKRPRKQF